MSILASKLLSKSSPLLLSPKTLIKSIHTPSNPNPNNQPLPSRFLQPTTTTSSNSPSPIEPLQDSTLNEFLSRFIHSIRPKLSEASPNLPRETLTSMLLIISQTVVDRLNPNSHNPPPIPLSADLWQTISDVAASVNHSMRRDRLRSHLRHYLYCDEVKQMCRFAGEVGLRGDFLRELRFKWAREKMDEVEFYEMLERMRRGEGTESSEKLKVIELPERRGGIRYRVFGLDLWDCEWGEVFGRLEEAERVVVGEEARVVVGRGKRVEERIMGLDCERGDLRPLFREFEEVLEARRVDWLALLERIKERNQGLYLKVCFFVEF